MTDEDEKDRQVGDFPMSDKVPPTAGEDGTTAGEDATTGLETEEFPSEVADVMVRS